MDSGCTRRELLGTLGTAAAGVAVADTAGAQQSIAEEWRTFGYDRTHTGHNPNGTGLTENPGGAWQYLDADRPYRASVAVADGAVYAANEDGSLYAVDATTGDLLEGWPVELGAPSQAAPTVADGTVYVGNENGTIRAFDADSAEQQWRFQTGGAVRGAPVIHDGVVYATSADGVVYAIDAATGGDVRWEFDTGSQTDGNVEIRGSPAVVTDGDAVTVYVANTGGLVYALGETETGVEQQWQEIIDAGQIESTPVVADGSVYVTSVQSAAGFLYALDTATGRQDWRVSVDGATLAAPAATPEQVYVGSRDGFLYAFGANNGEQQWQFDTERQINSSPVVVDGTVYVTNFGNDTHALTTAGEERWVADISGGINASPVVAGGRLYVGSDNSGLYALGSGGSVAFQSGTTTGESVEDSPLASPDNSPFAFLALPAVALTFFGLLGGGLYLLFNSEWAEGFAVDEAPIEKIYEEAEETEESPEMPGFDQRSETDVWSVIVGDVIGRAEHSKTVAQENVIVTKYIDTAMESPVTAYEVESARDEPTAVVITEPLLGENGREALADQPLNEGWRIDDGLTFETTIEPGETVRTMVGRPDTPEDGFEHLLERPTVAIDAEELPAASSASSETDEKEAE